MFKTLCKIWTFVSHTDTAFSLLGLWHYISAAFITAFAVLAGWLVNQDPIILFVIGLATFALMVVIFERVAAYRQRQRAESESIDWDGLASKLKKIRGEHSNVHLVFVANKRALFEKLKATFELAGWEVSCVPSPFDQHPQGGAFNYYEGTDVKGNNRLFVNRLANELETIGFRDVFTTMTSSNVKPDNPKFERLQNRVTILIGHDKDY